MSKKLLWIILIIIMVAGSFFIPGLMGFSRDSDSSVSLQIRQEYIYMAAGLVLMIGPWAWYIIRRKKDEDED